MNAECHLELEDNTMFCPLQLLNQDLILPWWWWVVHPAAEISRKIPIDLYRNLREIYALCCVMLSTSEPLLFTCRMKRWIFLKLFMLYLTPKSPLNNKVQPLKSSFHFLAWPPWIPTQKSTLPCESTPLSQSFIYLKFQSLDTNSDRKFTTLFSKEMVGVIENLRVMDL